MSTGSDHAIPVRQVQRCHVERHAAAAIAQRHGRHMPDAVLGSAREDCGAVILHLNSGGNAAAAEAWLRALGYRVEPTDYDPYASGHYGVKLCIRPGQPPDELWCAGSGIPPRVMCLDLLAGQVQPRGICAHCGRDMPIRGNGTLRKHQADPGTRVRSKCAAGLRRPARDARESIGHRDG